MLTGLSVSFILFLLTVWLFSNYIINCGNSILINEQVLYLTSIVLLTTMPIFPQILISIDLFGFILLFLAYLVGFLSLLALDTRLYWKNFMYIFTFTIFLVIVYLYITTTNILMFFLFYELLLLPSFLFIYFVSPSRRAVQASIYFVIWTQIGSFLIFLSVCYIIAVTGVSDFEVIRRFEFSKTEVTVLFAIIFLGFGFKIPIWPFHYWLTKTHVEAPSGFSIYLSGFLVKSALYGFYKLTGLFVLEINTSIYILITLIGVLDASLKMWGQTDLKKLVAYGTIQEMNLIYLVFCWGDSSLIVIGLLFTATHAFLSSLMFFIVDCVYRRYHTRSIVEINGLLHITPNLGVTILLMVIFFSGLPGTIKFISEFYIFTSFMEVSPLLCIFLMIGANVIGLVGFSKCWFNVVFGSLTKSSKYMPLDLNIKELQVLLINFSNLIFITYFTYVFF